MSYRFHVDSETGDLVSDHFGGPADSSGILAPVGPVHGWLKWIARVRREFPDLGRGDFRSPAVQIRQTAGHAVSEFTYKGHDITKGKPTLGDGLPATFGADDEVHTLVVHLVDEHSAVAADLSYSVFPKQDAIVRSVKITNNGTGDITVDKLSSFSVDMPLADMDMIELRGEWAREASRVQRRIDYGTQG
jgi:alpha-galactosidase